MDSLSPHGVRSGIDPSRRNFLITMIGAGVMLGYARAASSTLDLILSERAQPSNARETIRTHNLVRHRSYRRSDNQHHSCRNGAARGHFACTYRCR